MYPFSNFFKDKHGQIVLAQTPNSPLIGWFIFTMLNLLWPATQPKMHYLYGILAYGFIFTWAWLEITSGVNTFRRLLGLIVLILIVWLRL